MCCYNGRIWHKPSAILSLRALPPISAVDKCYLRELGSCGGGISGEHLISESIMLLLQGDGDFSISGVPWLAEGETKILPTGALTANCLCRTHNSALSPLDSAALYFFRSLKSSLEDKPGDARAIVSGHDIERWLLKTVKALAASRNLARGTEKLSGAFSSDIQVLNMLDDPASWPEGAGLYCVMSAGDLTENHRRFQLQPYTNHRDEICGLTVSILGLVFVLMLEPPDSALRQRLGEARYRPGSISITYPSSTSWIFISWEDGKPHKEFALRVVRTIGSMEPLRQQSVSGRKS